MSTYFMTLPKDRRPSRMPLWSDAQALLEKDDLRGLSGDVDGRRDGDSDVRRVERGCVVDPVAEESDDVAAPLQGEQDPILLRRRDAGEHGRPLRDGAERGVGHGVQVGAHHETAVVETYTAGDVARHALVVAGQDLDRARRPGEARPPFHGRREAPDRRRRGIRRASAPPRPASSTRPRGGRRATRPRARASRAPTAAGAEHRRAHARRGRRGSAPTLSRRSGTAAAARPPRP